MTHFRILATGNLWKWFTFCRRYTHDYQGTAIETVSERLHRCGTCGKEKWGEKGGALLPFIW